MRGTLRIGKRPKSLEEAEHKRIQEKAIVSFFSSIFLGLCFLLYFILFLIFFSRASCKIIEAFERTGIWLWTTQLKIYSPKNVIHKITSSLFYFSLKTFSTSKYPCITIYFIGNNELTSGTKCSTLWWLP